eukprot:11602668-Alexandrium_andersonii.AAC.1
MPCTLLPEARGVVRDHRQAPCESWTPPGSTTTAASKNAPPRKSWTPGRCSSRRSTACPVGPGDTPGARFEG